MWSELPGVPRSCAGGVLAGMVSADPCCVFAVAVACQSNPVRPTRPERPPERSSACALVRLPMFHPVEILNEWATRTNRLRGDAPRVDDYAQRWLDDGSLLIFGGEQWKNRTLHRVQRVDRRAGMRFHFPVEGFETRRVNFTLRFVPEEHVVPFAKLAPQARDDVRRYVAELAKHSSFFRRELERETRAA